MYSQMEEKSGPAVVIYPPPRLVKQEVITHFEPVIGSAQFKELYAIAMALTQVQEPMNLFSDSLYVVNLLPTLVSSYTKLDKNPITPLMIQVRSLLKERAEPIFLQHLRGHQNLLGSLAQGNAVADQIATSGTSIATAQPQAFMT